MLFRSHEIYEEIAFTDSFRHKMKRRQAKTPAPWATKQGMKDYIRQLVNDYLERLLPDFRVRFQQRNGRMPIEAEICDSIKEHIRQSMILEQWLAAPITNDELKQAALSWPTFRRHYAPICKELLNPQKRKQ